MSAKTICIILADGFEEVEALQPADIFKRLGLNVILVGLENDTIRGAHDICVIAQKLLKDIKFEDFDALMLPGGLPGATNLQASKKVAELLNQANAHNKICAAICAAPIVLHDAGITKNKTITGYPNCETLAQKPNCTFSGSDVEVDGNIITAIGMGKAALFAFAIATALGVPKDKIAAVAQNAFIA